MKKKTITTSEERRDSSICCVYEVSPLFIALRVKNCSQGEHFPSKIFTRVLSRQRLPWPSVHKVVHKDINTNVCSAQSPSLTHSPPESVLGAGGCERKWSLLSCSSHPSALSSEAAQPPQGHGHTLRPPGEAFPGRPGLRVRSRLCESHHLPCHELHHMC